MYICSTLETIQKLSGLFTCSCGRSRKNNCEKSSCSGKRCPCNVGKSGCSISCTCNNCANIYGLHLSAPQDGKTPVSRKRRLDVSGPSVKGFDAVSMEPKVMQGSWSDSETIGLFVCQNIVQTIGGDCSDESISTVYNIVANHETAPIRAKTEKQVKCKLARIKKEFSFR